NETFLAKLRAMFRDRDVVELIVHDVESESDYPFNNPAQVKFLEEALERSRNEENLISFENMEELRRFVP
ncbi:MAG TPA: hypothetical protein VGM92_10625, partial [Candidatus Kapabacteria bacterium]